MHALRTAILEEFDEKTKKALKHYVYALIDPDPSKGSKGPFYIGSGENNRVFDHVKEAGDLGKNSEKLSRIREIRSRPGNPLPQYLILRHGLLSEQDAYLIESVLIDCFRTFGLKILNDQSGHHSKLYGVLSVEEVRQRYQALPLNTMSNDCVIININRKFRRWSNTFDIYQATKQKWVIARWRIGNPEKPLLKYVLSEFDSIIVEVFEVEQWYEIGKRWGFEGKVAPENVRKLYLNRRIKKRAKQQWPLIYQI